MYATTDGSSMIYPMKYHRQVEICLVTEGSLTLTVEEGACELHPGDLYVIFPNVLHAVDLSHVRKKLWMFSPELVPTLPELMTTKPQCPVLRREAVNEMALRLLNRCITLYQKDKKLYRQLLIAHTASLMQELLLELELTQVEGQRGLAQRLTGYLMENFRRDITLESAAKALGYSKYYISHAVAELFGCNFRTLVNNYRISAAQEALLDKHADIWQIAYACGFQNQSTFNRTFVKVCGMTPTEYRRSQLGAEKP